MPVAAPAAEPSHDRLAHPCRVRDAAGGRIRSDWCLDSKAGALVDLPDQPTDEDLVRMGLRLHHEVCYGKRSPRPRQVEVFYAPFETLNPAAKVILVGITPGRRQMLRALRTARDALRAGATGAEVLARVSEEASFRGLRGTIADMLDDLSVGSRLGLVSSAELFDGARELVSYTSAIAYPVFLDGEDYSGRHVPVANVALLREFVLRVLGSQLAASQNALVVPLGQKAEAAVAMCIDAGLVRGDLVLRGFPHPSGRNRGNAPRLFAEARSGMQATVDAWSA